MTIKSYSEFVLHETISMNNKLYYVKSIWHDGNMYEYELEVV